MTRIAAGATEADRKHDQSVNAKLFPAMERGDVAGAHAALLLADKYVRIPLEAQEKIGAYVSKRQADDVEAAKSAAAAARSRGAHRGVVATLLALTILVFVSRGIRRSVKPRCIDRLSTLERDDATAVQDALDADRHRLISRARSPRRRPRSRTRAATRSATIARAHQRIRDRLHGSVFAYNGCAIASRR